jgi:hypothetical protein
MPARVLPAQVRTASQRILADPEAALVDAPVAATDAAKVVA